MAPPAAAGGAGFAASTISNADKERGDRYRKEQRQIQKGTEAETISVDSNAFPIIHNEQGWLPNDKK